MRKILIIVICFVYILNQVAAQVWSDDFIGLDSITNISTPEEINPIYLMDIYNSGDSILFFGGGFYYVNDIEAHGIGSWNGDTVYSFQDGVDWGLIESIIEYNDTLYIGGSFNTASNNPNTARLAVWNGEGWQSPSIGQPGSEVRDFCIYHDTLFIAGNFSTIGGVSFDKIAAYNGEEWINVGSFGMYARALEVFNGELYAGGYWGVRRYLGGTEWEIFDIVPNGQINELTVDTINTFLFVGGQITQIDGEDSWGSAVWDGFNWTPMGVFYGNTVFSQASAMYRGEYYLGNGYYFHEDDTYETFIKKWNGESWDSIGGNFNDNILSLEVFRDTLYIGGGFTYWGGDSPIADKRSKGLVKLYMPDNGCDYLKPRINTYADTFYLEGGEVDVNLYNNNPYADTWEWSFGDSQIGDVKDPVHTYTAVGEYNVQVTVTQDGCVKSAEKMIYIAEGSGIKDIETIEMQIFPNPSSNDFMVKTSLQDYKNAEIKIAGLNGHLKDVIPVNGETTIIPTKGWSAGTYICNLFIEEKLIKTEKLVFE
ncbi:MAG: PKD domain-containing protein [Bacteroidales bacterium]|nr:PKD domain-containing protein [Bacteroidales bacterium]